MDEPDDKQTPREILDKLHAMTPEEFSRFMAEHFQRLCARPLPSPPVSTGNRIGG